MAKTKTPKPPLKRLHKGGRKRLGARALTSTERGRRHRARKGRTILTTRPVGPPTALTDEADRELAHRWLGEVIERLHEALVSGVPGMDDSRGFVLGHKTGLQRAIALVEAVKTEKLTELDPRMVQQGD